MERRFGTARRFFLNHYVGNYCPLIFLEDSGRNRTPQTLRAVDKPALFEICDRHLVSLIRILRPEWVIGVGRFAESRIEELRGGGDGLPPFRSAGILHPSPANPRANRGWEQQVVARLYELGVWKDVEQPDREPE